MSGWNDREYLVGEMINADRILSLSSVLVFNVNVNVNVSSITGIRLSIQRRPDDR
jgi:hypothetical protein